MQQTRDGARRGVGRPPAVDKADHVIYVRLTTAGTAAAMKKAKQAGYATIAAYVKAWLQE